MLLRRIKAMLERRTGLPFIGRQRPKLAPQQSLNQCRKAP